jgi:hypothetical protein
MEGTAMSTAREWLKMMIEPLGEPSWGDLVLLAALAYFTMMRVEWGQGEGFGSVIAHWVLSLALAAYGAVVAMSALTLVGRGLRALSRRLFRKTAA